MFITRLKHYINFKEIVIPDIKERKNLSAEQVKEKECALILNKLSSVSHIVLLDEKGKEFSSVEFSGFLQKHMNMGCKEMCVIIGGAYGVAETLKQKAHTTLSLSQMTFTHQFIRLMIAEQLYRAMTILKNEPYHNN